jgi:hypothetical protein
VGSAGDLRRGERVRGSHRPWHPLLRFTGRPLLEGAAASLDEGLPLDADAPAEPLPSGPLDARGPRWNVQNLEAVEPLTRAEVKEIAEQTLGECLRRAFADLPDSDELEQRRRLAETILIMQRTAASSSRNRCSTSPAALSKASTVRDPPASSVTERLSRSAWSRSCRSGRSTTSVPTLKRGRVVIPLQRLVCPLALVECTPSRSLGRPHLLDGSVAILLARPPGLAHPRLTEPANVGLEPDRTRSELDERRRKTLDSGELRRALTGKFRIRPFDVGHGGIKLALAYATW